MHNSDPTPTPHTETPDTADGTQERVIIWMKSSLFCSSECARQCSRLDALSSTLRRRDDLGWWLRPLSVADCTAAGGRLTARPYITTCTDSPREGGGGVNRLRERETEASERLLGGKKGGRD